MKRIVYAILHKYAKDGDVDNLRHVYNEYSRPPVYISKCDISSSLISAAEYGQLEAVYFLLELGAEIRQDTVELAARNGHLEIIRTLVDRNTVVIHENTLREAANHGRLDVLKFLLDHSGYSPDTILSYAVTNNCHFKTVRFLLDYGANIILLAHEPTINLRMYRMLAVYKLYPENVLTPYQTQMQAFNIFIKWFGFLRRHVHTLQELSRKSLLIIAGTIPENIETIDLEPVTSTFNTMIQNICS